MIYCLISIFMIGVGHSKYFLWQAFWGVAVCPVEVEGSEDEMEANSLEIFFWRTSSWRLDWLPSFSVWRPHCNISGHSPSPSTPWNLSCSQDHGRAHHKSLVQNVMARTSCSEDCPNHIYFLGQLVMSHLTFFLNCNQSPLGFFLGHFYLFYRLNIVGSYPGLPWPWRA